MDLVAVKTFLNRYEAELAKGILKEKGVEAIVAADDLGGHLRLGGVQLLVASRNLKIASEVLEALNTPE